MNVAAIRRRSAAIGIFLCGLMLPACQPSEPVKPETPQTGQSPQPAAETSPPATEGMEPAAEEPSAAVGDLEPIRIELPQPQFPGTPPAIRFGTHVEKPLGKARPPFLAPKGTVNLALGKPVSSSDRMPIIGELDLITDGDKEGSEGSYVELGPGKQYVQIDLGAPCTLYAVVLWHYHKEPRVYHDVVVQASDDPDFISAVTTLFNNDYDNSAGLGVGDDLEWIETNEGRLIDAKGVKARYVRLYSAGNTSNDLNHYTEVEVYGQAAP